MNQESLTTAQEQILKEVWDKLKEHFDSVLLCINTEVPEGTDNSTITYWHGGRVHCIGLAEYASFRLKTTQKQDDEGESE